ncbi:MAG: 2-oxoacid:acceptor oxidoreductase subunit alpha [Candidatus Thorarchaeota archaeon]|nr:MAG: 2-oxoacid:acceptor oxidoreductase subunit alpha [Candidatus Thorarchaeota archaeon]
MKREASIVLAAPAGYGVQTVEEALTTLLMASGLNVFATRELMSRIRGGMNSTEIRVSSDRVAAYMRHTDIAVPLSKGALQHLMTYSHVDKETLVMGEKENLVGLSSLSENQFYDLPISRIAAEIGGSIYSNSVAVGAIMALFDIDENLAIGYFQKRFGSKGDKVVQQNIDAYRRGSEFGQKLVSSGRIQIDIKRDPRISGHMLLDGAEAVGLGAIAGGCNFISSYPMSPSTPVLIFLSQHSQEFGIIVDQAEDEISAMNKGIGAWYAGARGMVTTSGGGFALMTEGLSLAGMLESPMVIHLGQRPGPATGLPTRTEQGDLKHVLNAGHGEFPRVLFAPSTIQDAFYLTQRAFNLADKYQVPVFVLTDQFLLESSYDIPPLNLSGVEVEKQVIRTDSAYRRYALTESGISPRGIPSYGDGLVVVDSDEHDEDGHITEDLLLRKKMVDKRFYRKLERIRKEAIPPELLGSRSCRFLVISWGSNYHVMKEALTKSERRDIAVLHFNQVYPLHESVTSYLGKAKKLAIVENNAGCQFGRLLQVETNISIPAENCLLKYDGMPFSVEEVVEFLHNLNA